MSEMHALNINPKYNYELANARECFTNLKIEAKCASWWMYLWIAISYLVDILMGLCLLAYTLDSEFELFDSSVFRIISLISCILKFLEMMLRARDRGVIACVVRDNYNTAAGLIGEKIADLEVLAQGGISKMETKTWKRINDYIENISLLSKKWPSKFVTGLDKVTSIRQQISSELEDNAKTIEQQMQTLMFNEN